MTHSLKVYGWLSSVSPKLMNQIRYESGQTRKIVAATSKAAAARAAGYDRPAQMFNLTETSNREEIALCLSRPGIVFYTRNFSSGRADYAELPAESF